MDIDTLATVRFFTLFRDARFVENREGECEGEGEGEPARRLKGEARVGLGNGDSGSTN